MTVARGKYIVLEGGDGCGKDTQLPLIVALLEALGHTVATFREPYDSPTHGTTISDMLFARNDQPSFATLPWRVQAEFMNLARAEIVGAIAEAVNAGTSVVVSRNWLSTMAYQGHEHGVRGRNLYELRERCRVAAGAIEPDLVILLDLPVAEARERQSNKDKDVHELQGAEFHERVRHGYLHEVDWLQSEGASHVRFLDVSGAGIDQVTEKIWNLIEAIL